MKPLSNEDWMRLARWPQPDLERAVVDERDHLRDLLAALLPRVGRVVIETTTLVFDDGIPFFECVARLKHKGLRVPISVLGAGSTPEGARLQAELFAIRRALFGRDVPVLGRLLDHGRVRVDLGFYRDEPLIQDDFHVLIRNDLTSPFLPPLPLRREEYLLRARLTPPTERKRTRYLVITGKEITRFPDLAGYIAPYLRLGKEVFLHRLLLALDRRSLNHVLTIARREGQDHFHEEALLHGHHHNGVGYDCRRANLEPLPPAVHLGRHAKAFIDYENPLAGVIGRGVATSPRVLLPAPHVITRSDFFDMLTTFDATVDSVVAAIPNISDTSRSIEAAREDERLGVQELKLIASREDHLRTLSWTLRALLERGGQASIAELRSDIFLKRLVSNTLRRALRRLEGAKIVASTALLKNHPSGSGIQQHYRLVRLPTPALVTFIQQQRRKTTQ